MIITIDGPGGSGKSTIARLLAKKLNFEHIDTGAMYRAVTWFLVHTKVDIEQDKEVEKALLDCDLQFQKVQGEKRYFVNGHDVSMAIRSVDITNKVSIVAAKPCVRRFLVEKQRELGRQKDIVCEGRDIGSVVFPQAELKVFLDADPQTRALRRFQELLEKFPDKKRDLNPESVFNELLERDRIDSSREHSPLLKPKDAVLIDTTNLSIDEVIEKIVQLHHDRTKT